MSPEKESVLASIDRFVETKLHLLCPIAQSWQPSDFVPDLTGDNWLKELTDFREAARSLPDELLVVLVGSTVTEEALPSYQTALNRIEGIGDKTGTSVNPWARWTRGWTSEENRHGDLLNRYLYLTGRVNMREVEVTIQHLLTNGFDSGHHGDPYNALVYTSFQERATRLSHAKVAQLARQTGEPALSRICNTIAGDEARHEEAYKCFMAHVFDADPSGAMLSMETMFTETIKMPALLMSDGSDNDVFACFSRVAQGLGVYTFADYIDIMDHLIQTWDITNLKGLSGPAAAAQDKICRMPDYYRRRLDWVQRKLNAQPCQIFPWLLKR